MNKLFLVQKLQQAERFIADRLAQIAALQAEVARQKQRADWLGSYLTGLMSGNLFRRLWTARKRVR